MIIGLVAPWLATSPSGGWIKPPVAEIRSLSVVGSGLFVGGGWDDSNMCLPEQSARDAALAELTRLDPAALDAAALMGQITDLATFISQAQGQLSRLTGALDASGGAAEAGHKSASAFLRTRCGLAPGRAAAVVATARGLREREATEKALHAGEVSFDQAQVIVQTTAGLGDAAGQAEQVLLEHAPGLDTARFRQFADEVAYRAYPDAAEEREQRRWDKRHLSFGLTLDSTGVLSGSCGDAVSYEIVRTAAEAFSPPAGQLDTRTAAQRRMDGLVAACRTALDGGSAPERHGNAPHITVLVKDETLAQATAQTASAGRAASAGPAAGAGTASSPADSPAPAPPADAPPGPITGPSAGLVTPVPPALITQASPGPATGTPGLITGTPGRITGAPGLITGGAAGRTGHGTLLTARQVLSLCCGAQISAIRWDNGLPLDVGRTARTEPPGLRRALEARDQGCRWTCCGALAAWATAHHIKPWSQGGATSLNDLALFCHLHHYFIHTLGWTITGDPNATLHLTHPGAGSPSTAPSPDAEPGSATPGQIVPTRRAPACPASTGRPARTARAPGMPPGVQLLRAMSERLARARGLGDRGGPVQPAQPGAVPLSQVQVGLDRVLDP